MQFQLACSEVITKHSENVLQTYVTTSLVITFFKCYTHILSFDILARSNNEMLLPDIKKTLNSRML